ncbi:hypothetical protein GGQ22_03205 [Nocardioides sp. zg-579]|uniref:Uncharacterized protein n=1 Tax=Nocardioides marmotae TaxID=2663857 RepID=A0A6I3J4M8_9ACTN|nr:hypothetical protein [Nocardioides marmotae]MCR6030446.1 hypothetical protein [Gordonia jinghuaiqii]MTB94082.1 hypothetical protein [Nocardioides marmotae]QKE00383.1 hypothetical protein HPC71_04285 [Nocardioides marmotae]
MDPAPRAFGELPRDPDLGVPVPFAAGTDVGYGDRPAGSNLSARGLDKRRVTQCALSRVCGVCGATLGRPLAFLGTRTEVDRLAFHLPPAHLSCAEALLAAYASVGEPLLGLDAPPGAWVLATTASFEFVRPGREDLDKRPTFQPSSALTEVTPAGG